MAAAASRANPFVRSITIIGSTLKHQATLRSRRTVRDLDEFLRFLAELEEVFGMARRRRFRRTTGDRFRL